MKRNNLFYVSFLIILLLISCSERKERSITILATTDLHGVILPYDFIEKKDIDVSLAGVSSYVKSLRDNNEHLLLLDNGDNLQGQPSVYFYNFIDTASPHILAEAMNYIGYDAGTVGNHDIEAGHNVYDRLVKEYNFPLLAANAVNKLTGEPYFKPFVVIEINDVRVAIMGLITPFVPNWLPPELYSGMEFRDMVETAGYWMPFIEKEKPDVVVGLFHSGWEDAEKASGTAGSHYEDGSGSVAGRIPGFDIIICGHNHNLVNKKVLNPAGDSVLILEGGSRSENIVRADVTVHGNQSGKKGIKYISGSIVDVKKYHPDPLFITKFASQKKNIDDYVNKTIATFNTSVTSSDSYFGPSPFVDLIHTIQLELTGADISFAAPLSFDVEIKSGPVTTGDMFKLYRFENMLYTMSLSGLEIRKYLEYSYSLWYNTMKGTNDHLLKFRISENGKPQLTNGKAWLKNQSYNFDSAAGIEYIVDVSKPDGERVSIKSFSDGAPFEVNKTYLVAVNSFRGNGGGGHFTEGSGIKREDLRDRLVKSTGRDLRYYIINYLEQKENIYPFTLNNWKLIPENWVAKAIPADRELLFGK
jgi:2',3'-cyclic-nucleotide 2'-phosphodiesterase / 3'-nucleotidase